MQQRALAFIQKLNKEGWTINEQMADQFMIFARAECARAVLTLKVRMADALNSVNYDR